MSRLWYDHPAKEWEEALPIGNGAAGMPGGNASVPDAGRDPVLFRWDRRRKRAEKRQPERNGAV